MEEGQDADSESYKVNLPKILSKLPCGGMQHGTVLKIEDFSQDLQVNVAIAQQDVWEGEQYDNPEQQFHIGGDVPVADSKPPAAAAAAKKDDDVEAADDGSDIEVWDGDNDGDSKPAAKKRAAEKKNGDDEPKKKKAKTDDDDDVEVIEID